MRRRSTYQTLHGWARARLFWLQATGLFGGVMGLSYWLGRDV